MNAFLTASFPAAPLASFEDFRHADLAAVEARMNQVIIPHRLVSHAAPARGRFRHCGIDLGGAFLSSVAYDFGRGRLQVVCPGMDEDYRIQVTLSGAGQIDGADGELAFGPSGFVVIHPDEAFRETFDARCHHLLLTVKRARLETAFTDWVGHPPADRIRFESSVVDMDGDGRALVRHMALICRLLDPGAGGADSLPADVTDNLMRLLLQSLRHNHSDEVHRPASRLAAASVRKVEDYIHARARDDISMPDLVEAAGCSQRSLHYGFMRRHGMSPMQYLRDYRLALCREALLRSRPEAGNVTQAALACGFTHMSKFTAAYKARFGETPSATRKRRGR